jgi:hypothetical protein
MNIPEDAYSFKVQLLGRTSYLKPSRWTNLAMIATAAALRVDHSQYSHKFEMDATMMHAGHVLG